MFEFCAPQELIKTLEPRCKISGSHGGEYEDGLFWVVAPWSLAIALMMEAARTSKMSVNFYQTTRRNNTAIFKSSSSHPCTLQFQIGLLAERKKNSIALEKASCFFWSITVNSLCQSRSTLKGRLHCNGSFVHHKIDSVTFLVAPIEVGRTTTWERFHILGAG
jgi:hypothetical protein